ncbi:ParB/RepB/Spo0J family partition protein [soil metagenome]
MDNSKKNVHNSGPLGMLVKSGQIKKVDLEDSSTINTVKDNIIDNQRTSGSYFRTPAGIEFHEQELSFVDPRECESWQYANRLADEMGDMKELIESIRENKQLQPALVRPHSNPHAQFKYEIIFGRRRHEACLKLGVPFLVIKKDIKNIQEAIISQDAENKFRKNVSNYSNSILYKRLLDDGVFKTEKELAIKLAIPSSTFNDLMAFSKIPLDIVKAISNIHELSTNLAAKIVSLLKHEKTNHAFILMFAPELGKTITSPVKLEKAVQQRGITKTTLYDAAKIIKSKNGEKLFTFKISHKGSPQIVLHKEFCINLDYEDLCNYLNDYHQQTKHQSGAPD